MKTILLALGFCLATLQLSSGAVTITLSNDGMHIVGSDALMFKASYPNLLSADKKKCYKPVQTDVTHNVAMLKYDGGGQLEVTVAPDGGLSMKGSNMPPNIKFLQLSMFINFEMTNGGRWQTGDAAAQPFPAEQPKNPHLYQGGAPTFTIRATDGKGVTITPPLYSYQELNDNRAWNWKIFNWMSLANYQDTMTYKFEDSASAP